MTQEALFALPPKLTDRQQSALEALTHAAGKGLNGLECGEQVHALRGCRYCRQGDCHWAAKEGRELLEKLVELELAVRRQHGRYTLPGVAVAGEDKAERSSVAYDPSTAPIPF